MKRYVVGTLLLTLSLVASHLRRDNEQGLTVRPELVEGWTVKPFMVRQAHHERLNLKLFRLKVVASLVTVAEPNFEIGGLVVDQTLSRVGHLFYEELINGWDVPDYAGTIAVRERPDIFAGNIVWIEVNDDIVFQERVGFRPGGIEEKAQAARALLELYIQQNKDALRDLEVY